MTMLRHFILIRYNKDTAAEHIESFCRQMSALPQTIPEISSLEIGQDILQESRSWDLILVMEFESVPALRRYQQHEAHQAVMRFNAAHVADVAAIDYAIPFGSK
jgi:transcriptional regulator NrdR family protein